MHPLKKTQNNKTPSLGCRLFSTIKNVLPVGKTKSAWEQQIKGCLTNIHQNHSSEVTLYDHLSNFPRSSSLLISF